MMLLLLPCCDWLRLTSKNAYIFMMLLLLPCSDGLLVRRKILRLYWLARVGMMRLWGIA